MFLRFWQSYAINKKGAVFWLSVYIYIYIQHTHTHTHTHIHLYGRPGMAELWRAPGIPDPKIVRVSRVLVVYIIIIHTYNIQNIQCTCAGKHGYCIAVSVRSVPVYTVRSSRVARMSKQWISIRITNGWADWVNRRKISRVTQFCSGKPGFKEKKSVNPGF